jgi:hypothetical protein
MNSIRFFLWSLVAAMTLQGFFHADEYGSAASMIGGMTLTLSVWHEAFGERLRSLFGSGPIYVGIPRALATVAIQETTRHPGLGTSAPQLRRALQDVQASAAAFTDSHVAWMLRQTGIVGALQSDPAGRALWVSWADRIEAARKQVAALDARLCGPMEARIVSSICSKRTQEYANASAILAEVKAGYDAWVSVLHMEHISARDWWVATRQREPVNSQREPVNSQREPVNSQRELDVELFDLFYRNLTLLHDVVSRTDPRIAFMLTKARSIATTLATEVGLRRTLAESLLISDLWSSCRDHVSSRESRIRELVVATGIQEMFSTHDRILNASMRIVSTKAERDLVINWFSEMSAQAWWLSEDMPSIVRRCIGHEGGDCRRIGPTEIAALIAQADIAATILKDWTRRLFIGMWNALPPVGLLFIVELAVLCIRPQMVMVQKKQKRIADQRPLMALTTT